MKDSERAMLGAVVGIGLTVPSFALAVLSTGGGHGDYGFARLLFPYTMLLTAVSGTITGPLIVLAFAQFPIYGLLIGLARSSIQVTAIAAGLILAHAFAAIACFSGILPNFS